MLSRLTNDDRYETAAKTALRAVFARRSALGRFINSIACGVSIVFITCTVSVICNVSIICNVCIICRACNVFTMDGILNIY